MKQKRVEYLLSMVHGDMWLRTVKVNGKDNADLTRDDLKIIEDLLRAELIELEKRPR